MNRAAITSRSSTWRERVVDYLSLERNVAIASAAVFLLGFGEELWKKFLPKYLEALGASTPVIGLFGTAEDFFDAVYQYPGGWIADHLVCRLLLEKKNRRREPAKAPDSRPSRWSAPPHV